MTIMEVMDKKQKLKLNKKHRKNRVLEETTLHLKEVWGIIFFFMALFVFITNQFPGKMGIIGHGITVVGSHLMGEAFQFFPICLLVLAAMTMAAPSLRAYRSGILGVFGFWTGVTITLENVLANRMGQISWPLPVDGGGCFRDHWVIRINHYSRKLRHNSGAFCHYCGLGGHYFCELF